jgi:hypothetical protein
MTKPSFDSPGMEQTRSPIPSKRDLSAVDLLAQFKETPQFSNGTETVTHLPQISLEGAKRVGTDPNQAPVADSNPANQTKADGDRQTDKPTSKHVEPLKGKSDAEQLADNISNDGKISSGKESFQYIDAFRRAAQSGNPNGEQQLLDDVNKILAEKGSKVRLIHGDKKNGLDTPEHRSYELLNTETGKTTELRPFDTTLKTSDAMASSAAAALSDGKLENGKEQSAVQEALRTGFWQGNEEFMVEQVNKKLEALGSNTRIKTTQEQRSPSPHAKSQDTYENVEAIDITSGKRENVASFLLIEGL